MIDMTRDEIDVMLENSLIGRLCMADREGRPYVIPLPFCWSDGALYIRLHLSGRKGEILRDNDRVCFEVDRFTDTLDDYRSVLIEGRLVEVRDLNEKARIRIVNQVKYVRLRHGVRPGHGRQTAIQELPLRKIYPDRISGRKKEPEIPIHQEVSA